MMKQLELTEELLVHLRDDSRNGLERVLAFEVLRLRKLLEEKEDVR